MIDLHIHTTATPHHSTWVPEELAVTAAQSGLLAIAATDHNTTASVLALQAAGKRHGVQVIAGVEIDSGFNNKLWHTLVYGVAPDEPRLLQLCQAVFDRNMADARALQNHLIDQRFRLDDLEKLDRPCNVADVATALARQNTLPYRNPNENNESAGMRYIITQMPQGYNPVGVDEVIEVAHQCGGVAVLAHPGRAKGIYAIPATEEDIIKMAEMGLDGIEVLYPTHTREDRIFYSHLAKRYHLLVTGGSDSHHPHQPLANWPSDDVAVFLKRMNIL
ncbi:MAG: PHP domain-containing protein [Chloroflexota bacterium]